MYNYNQIPGGGADERDRVTMDQPLFGETRRRVRYECSWGRMYNVIDNIDNNYNI